MQLNYFQSFVITDSSVGVFPDYVCVLDLGMFELSLFTSDGSEQVRTPKQKSIEGFFLLLCNKLFHWRKSEQWESSCVHEEGATITQVKKSSCIGAFGQMLTCRLYILCIKSLTEITKQRNLRKITIWVRKRQSLDRILVVEHGLMTFPGSHKIYESRISNIWVRTKCDFRYWTLR